jgi:hypothetical protein
MNTQLAIWETVDIHCKWKISVDVATNGKEALTRVNSKE